MQRHLSSHLIRVISARALTSALASAIRCRVDAPIILQIGTQSGHRDHKSSRQCIHYEEGLTTWTSVRATSASSGGQRCSAPPSFELARRNDQFDADLAIRACISLREASRAAALPSSFHLAPFSRRTPSKVQRFFGNWTGVCRERDAKCPNWCTCSIR